MGFDFEGVYAAVEPGQRLEYTFGERKAVVEFTEEGDQTHVRVSFEPEETHSLEQQQSGWQAILDNFKRHIESPHSAG